jgi:ankyrin repeat protein
MQRFMLVLGLGAALLASGACDRGPDTPLAQAAVRNDVAALRQLLHDGYTADERGDSWTALIWASRSGSIDAITLLLDAGADVNLAGPTGDDWDATPLQHAILERKPAAVRILLDRGADVNRGGGPGSLKPLFLAAGDTDPAILKLLLAHGADPTVEDENGVTPLFRAVSAGTLNGPDRPMFGGCRVETVRALIAHDPGLRLKRNAAWNDAIWWPRFQRCEDVLNPQTKRQRGPATNIICSSGTSPRDLFPSAD